MYFYVEMNTDIEMNNESIVMYFRYSVMQWCWEMDPEKRPSFSALVETISKTLEDKADYLKLGACSDHYDISSSGHAEEA